MRWERLFEDLEAEADEASRAERREEVADRTWREVGRQQLTDRLRAAVGEDVAIRLAGAAAVHGVVAAAGTGWVLVDEPVGSQALVPMRHIAAVNGLGRKAAVPGSQGRVGAGLGLGYVLRGISRERARVVVTLVDGATVTGLVVRVGADFVDIADDATTARQVRAMIAIPLTAVVLIRRAPS